MPARSSTKVAALPAERDASPLAVEAPADVSASVLSDSSVAVSWSASEDPLSFMVAWAEAGGSSWAKAAVAGGSRSHVVSGLRPGTPYAFQVQAQSEWSDSVEAETTGSALEAPTLTVTGVLDRNATVNILTPTLAGQSRLIEVQAKDTRTDSPWFAVTEVPWNLAPLGVYDTLAGLKGLSTGTTYAVRARVTAGAVTSDWGPELRFATTGTKGGKPSLSVVPDSATYSSVRLSWGTSSKATVRVFRWTRSTSGGSPFLAQQVGYSTELSGVFEDSGLLSATDYWYTVEWMRDSRTVSVSNPVAVRTRG